MRVVARARARAGERRSFLEALRRGAGGAIVAEIKRASPSAGLIARSFDPEQIGRAYDESGCDAISVLTERDHFLGELSYLETVRAVTSRPLLRKDFLWTRYQIAQSAAYGADCVLLIVAGLDDAALAETMDEAARFALDVLVEVHDERDLERAVAAGARLVGINNRNLRTLGDRSCGERAFTPEGSAGRSLRSARAACAMHRMSRVCARREPEGF